MEKCGRWWRIRSEQSAERHPASDTSSEPSSDAGPDNSQIPDDADVNISEPELQEWEEPEEEIPSISESAGEGLFSQTGSDKPDIFVEDYHGAARIIDTGPNLFDRLWESDEYHEFRRLGGPFYPFSGLIEWEVVQWLSSLDVPMEKIDHFFDLSYVSLMQV